MRLKISGRNMFKAFLFCPLHECLRKDLLQVKYSVYMIILNRPSVILLKMNLISSFYLSILPAFGVWLSREKVNRITTWHEKLRTLVLVRISNVCTLWACQSHPYNTVIPKCLAPLIFLHTLAKINSLWFGEGIPISSMHDLFLRCTFITAHMWTSTWQWMQPQRKSLL